MLVHGWSVGGRAPPLGRLPSTRAIDASRTFEKHDRLSNTLLRVRIVDTPGYGDRLDNKRALGPIASYARTALGRQYARERAALVDTRGHADQQLHALLYFVSPHRLLRTDELFLRALQQFMPVIVVIAKADTLTDDELAAQRAEISARLVGGLRVLMVPCHPMV
jgi:septin family protein